MNKGVIMEKHRKYTIVLTKDGIFQKAVPIQQADIGEEVEFEPLEAPRWKWNRSAIGKYRLPFRMAAALAVIMLLAIPAFMLPGQQAETYAYVSIDINPSIELQVDEDLNVTKLVPLNNDARSLLVHLDGYEGKGLDRVVGSIMEASEKQNLIKNGKNMLVGVSYANGQQQDVSVLEHLHTFFSKDESDWKVATIKVPVKVRNLAMEKKQSANELLARKLLNPNSDVLGDETFGSVSEKDKDIIHSFYKKREENRDKKKAADETEKSKESSSEHKDPVKPAKTAVKENGRTHSTSAGSGTNGGTSTQTYSKPSTTQSETKQNKTVPDNRPAKTTVQPAKQEPKKVQGTPNNNSKNEDYKKYKYNNPYRNKDYENKDNKNRGEYYKNKHQNDNNDDDDDEDDD